MTFTSLLLAQETTGAYPGLLGDLHERMGFEWNLFFSQVVLFAVVAFALKRFAYEPILQLLDERRKTIQESLENAAKVKEELAAAQAKYAEIVREANAKANALVEEARKVAELQGQKVLAEAQATAEAHVANARAATAQERDKVLRELKNELLRLVVDATGRATGKILTAEDQERIKGETLAAVGKN